ncbi:hypothetical protein [Microcoleus sp. T3_D1]|uniref:hypothetical protein n=1 Tax=Microcoleus sp. T3_D1 TaxID=3055427 RepID=UPI002FD48006
MSQTTSISAKSALDFLGLAFNGLSKSAGYGNSATPHKKTYSLWNRHLACS